MAKTLTLSFEIPQKEILNSNSMPSHHIVKGKLVAKLRALASEKALAEHPEAARPAVEAYLEALRLDGEQQLQKRRVKKRLEENGLFKEAIEKQLEEDFPAIEKDRSGVQPPFTHFTMRVDVYPPSRRRLDPPNLWPSVKALTDGATDAVAWEDDDFAHLLETSFRYGGLSGLKNTWRLNLVITEVEDLSGYQLETEVAS